MEKRFITETTAPSVEESTFDALHQSMEDDFAELLCAYRESTSSMLEALAIAIEIADHREVERLAHSIKSSSASIGARRLSESARKLESLARQGDIATALDYAVYLKNEFERVCDFISAKKD